MKNGTPISEVITPMEHSGDVGANQSDKADGARQASRRSVFRPKRVPLSSFRQITLDTARLVDAGDMQAAKARITDLETAWDQAEEKLRPIDPEGWTSIDKSLDRALKQVRTGSPDLAACTEALDTLSTKITSKSVH